MDFPQVSNCCLCAAGVDGRIGDDVSVVGIGWVVLVPHSTVPVHRRWRVFGSTRPAAAGRCWGPRVGGRRGGTR